MCSYKIRHIHKLGCVWTRCSSNPKAGQGYYGSCSRWAKSSGKSVKQSDIKVRGTWLFLKSVCHKKQSVSVSSSTLSSLPFTAKVQMVKEIYRKWLPPGVWTPEVRWADITGKNLWPVGVVRNWKLVQKTNDNEHTGSSSNASDLYSGGALFKSQLTHQQSWCVPWYAPPLYAHVRTVSNTCHNHLLLHFFLIHYTFCSLPLNTAGI